MTIKLTTMAAVFAAGIVLLASELTSAAGQYGPGVSDTEIKIGNTVPYSGSASALGVIGKSEAAYFAMSRAGSTDARSASSAATTATVRRRLSNKCAGWSRRTRCCSFSVLSGRHPTPRSRDT